MLSFFRELLAVPLRLLLFVCGMVEIVDKIVVAKWVWGLTGEPDDAVAFLGASLQKNGLEASKELAEELLLHTRDAKIANLIACYELNSHSYDEIQRWIDKAVELECKNQELLLWVKFYASLPNEAVSSELILDEMIERNDLPSHYSETAWGLKSWRLVCDGEWEKAEFYANRVLEIKDNWWALLARMAIEVNRGEESKVDRILEKAERKAKQDLGSCEKSLLFIARALAIVGYKERACEYLYEVRGDIEAVREDELLSELAESEMFKEYCAGREGER